MQGARRIAIGEIFLGRKTIHTRVLYAVTELDRTAIHERLKMSTEPVPSNLFIRYGWSNGEEGICELETVVKEHKIEVVIIDMFSAVLPTDAQTNSYDLTPFLLKWRQMAHRLGVCVVAVWHSGKAEKKILCQTLLEQPDL